MTTLKTREIPLTQGKVALVSECDFERVSQHKWNAYTGNNRGWYARSWSASEDPLRHVSLHRFILGYYGDLEIDHKDLDGLNNTRENLRIATTSQNHANQKKRKGSYSSQYKGVSVERGLYLACVMVNRKQIRLGRFKEERDAAIAYDEAAVKYFGEYARTNF